MIKRFNMCIPIFTDGLAS